MKGKKTDPEFLSNFITECVTLGIEAPTDIVARAKKMILNIDDEIKKVEKQKFIRCKLLDVINAFEKPSKVSRSEEAKILSFFKMQNPLICKHICSIMKNKVIVIKELYELKFKKSDILFCVKQLIEYKIISCSDDCLLRGEMFDEYLKFVLKEDI